MNLMKKIGAALVLISSGIACAKVQVVVNSLSTDTQKPVMLQFIHKADYKKIIFDKNKKVMEKPVLELVDDETLNLGLYDGPLIIFYIDITNKNNTITMSLHDESYAQIATSETTLDNNNNNYDIQIPIEVITETVHGKKISRPSQATINAIKEPQIIEKKSTSQDEDIDDWTLID